MQVIEGTSGSRDEKAIAVFLLQHWWEGKVEHVDTLKSLRVLFSRFLCHCQSVEGVNLRCVLSESLFVWGHQLHDVIKKYFCGTFSIIQKRTVHGDSLLFDMILIKGYFRMFLIPHKPSLKFSHLCLFNTSEAMVKFLKQFVAWSSKVRFIY